MGRIVRNWENGGSLSVAFTGSGDGEAVFSSTANEGIDREMSISFSVSGASIKRTVKQIGLREVFNDFTLADGGSFNVIK